MVNPFTLRSTWLISAALFVVASVGPSDSAAATFKLSVDDEQGRPIPCRVLVRAENGDCYIPGKAVELAIAADRWFISDGRSSLEVPRGTVELRVEHGLEYVRIKEPVRISGASTSHTVTLHRWIDMAQLGYKSGENHLLVEAEPLGPMLAAEGLDFGTMIQWWNNRLKDVPQGSGHIRELEFGGRRIPASMYDVEVEHAWGVVCLQNLPAQHPFEDNRGLSNLPHVKHAREVGGIVSYQGGYSPEVALDALLGYVDIVHVCNNNFHLHRYQPRRRYSNLLEVPGFPEYENSDVGMMQMNTETYYRLLNWGLQLAAGAGTSTGAKQVPVGYNRGYVRCKPQASIEAFYRNWTAGRNFVTNGPMLFLETLDGHKPGDTVALPAAGGRLRVRVTARSDQPLTGVEIIVNGEVKHQIKSPSANRAASIAELNIQRGSWIAARATARDGLLSEQELALYANGKSQQSSRLRFAHTSPIYVTVGGNRAAVPKSIEEGLAMLTALEAFAGKHSSGEHLPELLEAIRAARQKLQSRREAQ